MPTCEIAEDGNERGRTIGFPTANLELGDYQRPRYGVYAVRVTFDDGRELPGVASLGVRPTFEPAQDEDGARALGQRQQCSSRGCDVLASAEDPLRIELSLAVKLRIE